MKLQFLRVALAIVLFGFGISAYAHPGMGMDEPFFMLGKAKAQLNLNTSQQTQWDSVVAQAKAAHQAAKTNLGQLKDAMNAELDKSEPDLAAVAGVADNVHKQNESSRMSVRAAWLALYATFTPEQKTVVRDTIKAGIVRMQARHAAHGAPASAPAATD